MSFFVAVILYYSSEDIAIGENWGKGIWNLSFLQLYVKLQLPQDKKLKRKKVGHWSQTQGKSTYLTMKK